MTQKQVQADSICRIIAITLLCITAPFAAFTGKVKWINSADSLVLHYDVGATAWVQVIDSDQNVNVSVAESFNVQVSSEVEGGGLNVTVTETGINTGIFKGSIVLHLNNTPIADAMLQADKGNYVTITYTDSNNDYGSPQVITSKAIFGGIAKAGRQAGKNTWTKAGGPYLLMGDINLDPTDTLIIQPGTKVLSAQKYDSLNINISGLSELIVSGGHLDAQGIDSDSIYFGVFGNSAPSNQDWYGIRISGMGSANLRYAKITGGQYGLYISSSSTDTISTVHSRFSSLQNGIFYDFPNSSSRLNIDSCQFDDIKSRSFYYYNTNSSIPLFFRNNLITVNNSDSIESPIYLYGYQIDSNTNISNNTIQSTNSICCNAAIKANVATARIEYNTISGFYTGIKLEGYQSPSLLSKINYNTITGGAYGLIATDSSRFSLSYNNIYGQSQYALFNNTNKSINARFNFWGTSVTSEITSGSNPKNISVIRDGWDNSTLGKVNYGGHLTSFNGSPSSTSTTAIVKWVNVNDSLVTKYPSSTTAWILVTDMDRNTNTGVIENFSVTVKSAVEPGGETVSLTETGMNTGVFRGSIPLVTSGSPITADAQLQAGAGNTLTLSYNDPSNDYNNTEIITSTAIYNAVAYMGYLGGKTTWTKAGGPYLIPGDLYLNYGDTLILQPGTVVLAAQKKDSSNAGNYVNKIEMILQGGHLSAQGNVTDSIYFGVYGAGLVQSSDWYGIRITGSGSALMDYVSIKGATNAVSIESNPTDTITINRSRFSQTKMGVFFDSPQSTARLQIDSCVFQNLESDAIYFSSYISNPITRIMHNTINISANDSVPNGISLWGYMNDSNTIVTKNTINSSSSVCCGSGIYLNNARPTLDSNSINGFYSGIKAQAYSNYQAIKIKYNTVTGGQVGLRLLDSVKVILNYNNIYGQAGSAVSNTSIFSMDAKFNWWGSSAFSEMNSGANPKNITAIFDGWDDGSKGKMEYGGWLNAINGTPNSVSYSGKISWTNAVDSSLSRYAANTTAWIKVIDPDRNLNAGSIENLSVSVTSDLETVAENVNLTETSMNSGIFTGSIAVSTNGSAINSDGILQAQAGNSLSLSYTDPANSYGVSEQFVAKVLYGGTLVAGPLSGKIIWTKAAGPYLLAGDITLPNSSDTLIIQSGTVVLAAQKKDSVYGGSNTQRTEIYVQSGHLDVQGAINDSVTFGVYGNSPMASDDWDGIYFSNSGSSQIKYARIMGARNAITLNSHSDTVTVKHCTFSKSNKGIQYNYPSSSSRLVVDSCKFDNLNQEAMTFYANNPIPPTLFSYNSVLSKSIDTSLALIDVSSNYIDTNFHIESNNISHSNGTNNASAIRLSSASPVIRYNVIQNFRYGIKAQYWSNIVFPVSNNTITGGAYGVFLGDSSKPIINYNSIYGQSIAAIYNNGPQTIDAKYNYWGPTGASEITSSANPKNLSFIYDYRDNASRGEVNYSVWAASPGSNVAPVFTSSPNVTAKVNAMYQYQASATDYNGDALTYSLYSGPSGLTVSTTGLVLWTPVSAGNFSVSIRVNDGNYSVDQSYSISAVIDATPSDNITTLSSSVLADSVTLNWTLPVSNHSDADSVFLRYSTTAPVTHPDSGILAFKKIKSQSTGGIKVPYGFTYYFSLIVRDSAGNRSTIPVSAQTSKLVGSTPVLVSQGGLNTVNQAAQLLLYVVTTGSPAPTFRWLRNGTDTVGTSDTLKIPNMTTAQAGNYYCIIKNAVATLNSSVLNVSVIVPPAIVSQNGVSILNEGQELKLWLSTTGTGPFVYRWIKNSTDTVGTSDTLKLSNVVSSQSGSYVCRISNSAATINSSPYTVTITQAPLMTAQGGNPTLNLGQDLLLWFSATGSAPMTHRWVKNGIDTVSTKDTLRLSSVKSSDAGNYEGFASNAAARVSTGVFAVVVNGPPIISRQSGDTLVPAGINLNLFVTHNESPKANVKWLRNGIDSVANGDTLKFSSVSTSNAATYTAVLSNSVTTINSNPIKVTVSSGPSFSTFATKTAGWQKTLKVPVTILTLDTDSMRLALNDTSTASVWKPIKSEDTAFLSSNGNHYFFVRLKNKLGQLAPWVGLNIQADTLKPTVTASVPPILFETAPFNNVSGKISDLHSGPLMLSYAWLREADNKQWRNNSWQEGMVLEEFTALTSDSLWTIVLPKAAFSQSGSYQFQVQGLDKAGNRSSVVLNKFSYQPNRAPELKTVSIKDTVLQNSNPVWTLSFADFDPTDSLILSTITVPTWLKWTQRDSSDISGAKMKILSLSGKPLQENVGPNNLQIQISDRLGKSLVYSKNVFVMDVNDPPVFTQKPATLSAKEDQSFQFSLSAIDPDPNQIINYSISGAPAWLKLNGNILDGTPGNDDVGLVNLILRVSDGSLADTFSTSLIIENVNDAPTLAGNLGINTTGTHFKEDSISLFSLTIEDIDKGDSLVLSSGLPAWIQLMSVKRLASNVKHYQFDFKASPLQKDTGTISLPLVFKDKSGVALNYNAVVTIDENNDFPTAVVNISAISGGAALLSLDVTDEDGNLAQTKFHYWLKKESASDTLMSGLQKGSTLSLFPLGDGSYKLFVQAEDGKGLLQVGFSQTNFSIQNVSTLALDSGVWLMTGPLSSELPLSNLASPFDLYHWSDNVAPNKLYGQYQSGEGMKAMERGKGYWIYLSKPNTLSVKDSELLKSSVTLNLVKGSSGWNQIANPYPYSVDVSTTGLQFWYWDAAKRDMLNSNGILTPWKAYFVQVNANVDLVLSAKPYFKGKTLSKASALLKSTYSQDNFWTSRVELLAGQFEDRSNFFGVRPKSSDFESSTLGEAPRIGNYVNLSFVKDKQGILSSEFLSSDIHADNTLQEHWWDFVIEDAGTGLSKATLAFENLRDLSENGYHIFLVEKGKGSEITNETQTQVPLTKGSRYYSLVVTKNPDFLSSLSLGFKLQSNAPNPVVDITQFRFNLPYSWDSQGKRITRPYQASLKVYDMRGREISTVFAGAFEPGSHRYLWNALDKSGRKLSGGQYVYRLNAEGLTESRKLIVR